MLSRPATEEPLVIARRLISDGIAVRNEDVRRTTIRVEAIRRRKMTGKKSKYGN